MNDEKPVALSKREAFAAAALPTVLMLCSCRGDWENATVVRRCYELADDMLAVGIGPLPEGFSLHQVNAFFRSKE